LKGCPSSEAASEVEKMIQILRLEDKRNVASAKLSGGMKRKLSVGIALIGGSKVITSSSSVLLRNLKILSGK
jgi:ATP-binding cassette subfamily A (ABC1) protein 3